MAIVKYIPRTRIRIQRPVIKKEKGKLDSVIEWVDIGNETVDDPPKYKYCSWKNSHGTDYLLADNKTTKNRPTILLRYDPRITSQCRILKDDEKNPYQIIGEPDNINDLNIDMEIRLERVVNG